MVAAPGQLVPVRITAAHLYDLEGELVGAEALVKEARGATRRSG
jgi:hypothetical protein